MKTLLVGCRALDTAREMRRLCRRFVREESGQDVIEYAILTAIVTVSSIVILLTIQGKIGPAYFNWQSLGQDNWIPSAPTVPIT
jgi:Flp pilus assembly pilin Flp